MKIRFLLLMLLCCETAHSDDGKERTVGDKSPKQGDTIWLEEKITPTTTWIENLVKPLTVWMEQQINEPDQGADNQEKFPRPERDASTPLIGAESRSTVDPATLISAEQASALAKAHIAGDVLYIKLVPKTNRYRVKLISKLGEIHIIYIKANSGEIISPNGQVDLEPVKQQGAEQITGSKEKL